MADRPELFKSDVVQEIRDEGTWSRLVDHAEGPVMVEFFVTWCPHCQREAPLLDEVAPQIMAGGVQVFHANAEVMNSKGPLYGIEETPSFVLLEHGKLKARHEGFLKPDQIIAFAHGSFDLLSE